MSQMPTYPDRENTMVNGTLTEDEVSEALRVLEAIRVLQRWLVNHPLGADALRLTPASLILTDGQDHVATISLPDP